MATIHRHRLSAGHDKALFLVTWAGGTAVLLVLKLFEVPALVVVGWTALVLLAYAAALWKSPQFKAHEDRAGDSCYYLGFLLTLSSLAYALWEFGRGDSDTGAVIENFAIALTGTILGLVLRVLFQQSREDPLEVEREVRVELSEVAGRLKSEMLQAIESFGFFRTAISQEMQEEFSKAIGQIAAASSEAVVTATSHHEETVSKALDSVAASAEAMKTHVAAVRAASKRTADAFEDIAQKLQRTELPTVHLERSLSRLTEAITSTVERQVVQLREQSNELDKASKVSVGAAEAMRQVVEQAQGTNQVLQALASSVSIITRSLENWNTLLSAGAANWKSATDAERKAIEIQREFLEQSATAVTQLQVDLRNALSESQSAVLKTQRSLASLTDTIVDRVS